MPHEPAGVAEVNIPVVFQLAYLAYIVQGRGREQEVPFDLRVEVAHHAAYAHRGRGVLQQSPQVGMVVVLRRRGGGEFPHELLVVDKAEQKGAEIGVLHLVQGQAQLALQLGAVGVHHTQEVGGLNLLVPAAPQGVYHHLFLLAIGLNPAADGDVVFLGEGVLVAAYLVPHPRRHFAALVRQFHSQIRGPGLGLAHLLTRHDEGAFNVLAGPEVLD